VLAFLAGEGILIAAGAAPVVALVRDPRTRQAGFFFRSGRLSASPHLVSKGNIEDYSSLERAPSMTNEIDTVFPTLAGPTRSSSVAHRNSVLRRLLKRIFRGTYNLPRSLPRPFPIW